MALSLEEQYFFLAPDDRGAVLEDDSKWLYPFLSLYDDQDTDWWSECPVAPQKPVDFKASADYPDPPEFYDRTKLFVAGSVPLMRQPLRDLFDPFLPDDAQFIPSYIITSRGLPDLVENLWMLHLWKMHDWTDPKKSIRESYEGEIFDSYAKIYLDEEKVLQVPQNERLVFRLCSLEHDFLLFHKDLVKIILEQEPKGALFIPLTMFGPCGSFFYDNADAINNTHPW